MDVYVFGKQRHKTYKTVIATPSLFKAIQLVLITSTTITDASGGGGTLSRRIRTLGASSANLSDGSGDLVFVVDDPDTSKLVS